MKNLKYIKSFVFDYAQYEVADESGNKGLLKVYYKTNTFDVETAGLNGKKLKTEASKIAKDLLKRKHGVNFAGK